MKKLSFNKTGINKKEFVSLRFAIEENEFPF